MLNKIWPPSPSTGIAFAALVIALGSGAFAATSTLVRIGNHSGSNIASVDGSGHLLTRATISEPKGSFFGSLFILTGPANTMIGPTTATLAISQLTADNYYGQTAGATVQVQFLVFYSTGTSCGFDLGSKSIGTVDVHAGQAMQLTFPSPVVIDLDAVSGAQSWCLVASTSIQGSPGSYFLPTVSWNGYVVAGSFAASAATASNRMPGAPPPRNR